MHADLRNASLCSQAMVAKNKLVDVTPLHSPRCKVHRAMVGESLSLCMHSFWAHRQAIPNTDHKSSWPRAHWSGMEQDSVETLSTEDGCTSAG